MKKRFSKLISGVLMMMLVLGVVPVQAAELETNVRLEETEAETNVQPRAALCGSCGIGTMVIEWYGSWSGWSTIAGSETDCIHHPDGEDVRQKRTRNIRYGCTYCTDELYSTQTEYRTVCYGY
ncbi:MAG: hypothetical protein ACLTPC_03085 [Lacrimispora saccharolytica]